MDDNKIDMQPLFLLSIPVLIAICKLLTGFDSMDVAYLIIVVIIFVRHYFLTKKEK